MNTKDKKKVDVSGKCRVHARTKYVPLPLATCVGHHVSEDLLKKFNIQQIKEQRLLDFQAEYTRQTKVKELRHKITELYPEVPKLNKSHKKIRKYAERCPSTPMSRFLEADMRNMVNAKGLEFKYPEIVNHIMTEVKRNFLILTHNAGVNLKVQPVKEVERCRPGPFTYLGKTERYQIYLWIRHEFSMRWMLHYPLARKIFKECVYLPDILFDLSKFRAEPLSLNELDIRLATFLKDAQLLYNKFYTRVVTHVERDKINLNKDKTERLLNCCTGLLSVYIGKTLSQTIQHCVDVISDPDLVPYMKISITFDNEIQLAPKIDEVVLTYSIFIMKLVENCKNYATLDAYKNTVFVAKNIYINITDEFLAESLLSIQSNLYICKAVTIEENTEITQETFSKLCIHLENFKQYTYKVTMLCSEYYDIGQLVLLDYIQIIKDQLNDFSLSIFEKMCEFHIKENTDIIDEYENIKQIALSHPNTTEELMEQGRFMVEVKGKILERLREETQDMLYNLTKLINLGQLSRDHLELNAVTINWIKKIEKILDINSINYEQLKFEAEERLGKNIAYIHATVADLCPKLVILDEMDDAARAREYLQALSPFMALLRDLKAKIDFIDKERLCLGFAVTPFEVFEECVQIVYQFFHLVKVCMNVNRSIAVWYDGPFEFLLYEDTERLMEEYNKELLKIQKSYRIKLRQAPGENDFFRKITQMGLEGDLDKYDVISSGATKERELWRNLQKMQAEWKEIFFKTGKFKETDISILTALDDIQVVLDDHIIKTLTMRGSVFVKPYEAEVRLFYDKLQRINKSLDEWGKVQAQWLYLLPIFSSKDIVAQMPEEGNLFKEVNDTYRRYITVVIKDPRVFETASAEGLLESMVYCNELLEKINEGVTNYLEKKRLFFPRFFFLSNDEMLEILSETKDPLRVQPHLKKCFEAISMLEFDDELNIHAMLSGEGEKVNFKNVVASKEAGGSVEKWLVQVEDQMVISVRDQLIRSYKNYLQLPRTKWMIKWPGQIVLAVSQMHWTLNVHKALNQEDGYNIAQMSEDQRVSLTDIVDLIRDPTLTSLSRITIKALIVIDVHAKDVVSELNDKNVKSDLEFKWLVITPLTDRCYRTLIGAYHLHLNGAPEGPAGTGKTETTKDLAKALAVQCVVFNCSDGLDYKAMGKFFKGLASCGAWVTVEISRNIIINIAFQVCFDEFNRIDVEVLSVVAQQISSIILAVRANAKKFMFEGTELNLNPACYVCITMNPGYAGRSELPDNLKVLFRTVAMMVPDYAMIGEISLYSYGFVDARNLSVKIVTTYRLCSEQLSSQNHYDYGMRAVKSVLSAAGIVLPKADYHVMTEVMTHRAKARNLVPKDTFLLKIIQTYEMMIVRWGFMIVGETNAGKSSTLKVLADTLTYLNGMKVKEEKVTYQIVNPKAITMGQLYGQFDPISYEWFDGVVAVIFRTFCTDPSPDRKWIIFDGPVDAVWIENMNSVLDDNKKLCLMSGEVMTLTNCMSLIFEVMDLEQASPATVSRCGMIFMESSTLGWRPFVKSWLPRCNKEWLTDNEEIISTLIEWMTPPSLHFIKKNCLQYCYPGEISLVTTMLSLVEMYLDDAVSVWKKDEDQKSLAGWIHAALMMAGVWGLGAILDEDSRVKFDEFFKTLWKGLNEKCPYPENIEMPLVTPPTEGLFVDNSYLFRLKGSWKYYPEVVKSQRVDECKNVLQALIPTVDTARYMALIDMHIRNKKQILIMGPTGTGKSFYAQDLLMNQIDKEKYEPAFITFTCQISANQCQDLVISKLNKRKRGHYGPPKGKISVLFIDDVNMPIKEQYGAQPPIELLRQYFDHKNWYDLKNTTALYMHDVIFIGAMGLVGGSRQDIYPRFLRHFNIFSINDFSEVSMKKIYINILLLGWKNNGFPSEIISIIKTVVNASLEIYNAATANLRPTPSKSHYVFNLRDFSRLIQGCSMLRKENAENRTTFAKIWAHEVLRVFYDRLIESQDKDWLFNKLKQSVGESFRENFDFLFADLPRDEDGTISRDSLKNLMFGSYFDQDSDNDKRYEEVENVQQLLALGEQCLEEYNSTHKNKMDIVLFDYALQHLSKICRILIMSCGSGLLVGISGSGRQSLTRLGSEIFGHKLYQPEITNNYGLNEWRDDIKKILKEAGGRGKDCTFLITEGQIKMESFLQDVDCLLNSGEVPNMYQIDEKQEILDMVRLAAQGGNRNLDVSALQVFFFFTKRCRERLHIILCFSPVGSTFRNRLRLYPSLINCCTIDWFDDWPASALEEVALAWMTGVNLSEEVIRYSVTACKYFHVEARKAAKEFFSQTNRKMYITSASYLELIRSFTQLTNRKQNELMKAKNRYMGGLEKLFHAAKQIGEMQVSLAALQPQLKEMSDKATVMLKQIEKETIQVEKSSALVKEDEKMANKQAAISQALKLECESDLAEAMPILNEALAALDTLKPSDITMVKAMKNPPSAVKLVMEAVCIIKSVKPDRVPDVSTGRMMNDYWKPSVRILGDFNFLESLKNFDKDNIKPEVMAKLRKEYITHKDFKPQVVSKASSAAEGLCKWIIAMDMYDKVNKVVGPKKAKLAAAEKEFEEIMTLLREKRSQVQKLEEKLAILNTNLAEAMAKQEELQSNVDLCNNKLIRAQKLIGGLGGEKTRWTAAAAALQAQYDGIAGDILISCGIISYLSPFNAVYRQRMVADWHKLVKGLNIPCAEHFDIVATLGSDVKIQNWNIDGLPRDSFSIENGIIMDSSRRWSLFIDPQSQASNWIKRMEKKNSLQVVKFSHSDYMKKIENCVQSGFPALVESIGEELEAPLDPLLFKSTFKQAGLEVIGIGENVIIYNKDFRLYLTSKYRNPHYLPEVFNRVTIINFALTLEGLQDQLLGIVVAVEKPDLQQIKEDLIVQKAQNRGALLDCEERILKTLSESQGDILEDENAIQILDESKILSTEIREKQEKSLEIEASIEEFRLKYQSVSEHSAILYYCISDLANIDPMYQYSLEWFINLYIGSIQRSEKSRFIEKRCLNLITAFTYDLYSNITRSLFEKDKLLFSFLLCAKIMIYQQKLDDKEFMFLLTGGVSIQNPLQNPSSWLPKDSWDELCRVDDLENFKGFRESFSKSVSSWQKIYDDFDEKGRFPEPWNTKLPGFRRLIVIRLLRPDKLIRCISNFVQEEMDERFIKPPPFNISVSYADSYSLSPLIFILSPGTDPMAALIKFAEENDFSQKFFSISLGQGQGPIAKNLIERGQEEGNWVCLQNCHLATSWMTTLEKIFEELDLSNTQDAFRLWLTSYPSNQFPVTLLQKGVKMTNEPPTGLQNNLLKSYINEPVKNAEFYNGCPEHDDMFARMLYGLAFFHAVVQERRTFGPLGWNIQYGFNDSDFDISVKQLQMFINESEDPFEALTYLIGECNYGGRVTDDWDRRLIVTILEDFINPIVAKNPKYKFSDVGTCYNLPDGTDYEAFINHIQTLPQMHPPEIFGLHTNAGITRDLKDSYLLLGSVLKAYGETAGGSGGETDKYLMGLTEELIEKIPNPFNIEVSKAKFPIDYSESMNTVLVQEMERFNRLLKVVKASLQTMQKAIQGLVAMSPAVEALGTSLFLARIPTSWASVSYPSLKNLPNYVTDLIARVKFLQTWFENGKPNTYWVSGFFFTQAFLTGVKQNYARKHKIPIDKLTFDFEIMQTENIFNVPKDGAYIYGLFTDGARWDRQKGILQELHPKILNDVMPAIWIQPIKVLDYKTRGRYTSPVYKTSERKGTLSTTGHSTNYVLPILLNTNVDASHWIKRSVACLCQLS
ncbi:unnamed protein product [Brassicogethes aeneus]|uniref:EF-hand domain-containing protein n=1 Tax=Brassicogethes aeneus TaxID=1431903 RepID=A0A9P0BG72_BRAAE|nr:unnamed protein product [Brassicogethes aeneus]